LALQDCEPPTQTDGMLSQIAARQPPARLLRLARRRAGCWRASTPVPLGFCRTPLCSHPRSSEGRTAGRGRCRVQSSNYPQTTTDLQIEQPQFPLWSVRLSCRSRELYKGSRAVTKTSLRQCSGKSETFARIVKGQLPRRSQQPLIYDVWPSRIPLAVSDYCSSREQV